MNKRGYFLFGAIVLILAISIFSVTAGDKISIETLDAIQEQGNAPVVIVMKEGTSLNPPPQKRGFSTASLSSASSKEKQLPTTPLSSINAVYAKLSESDIEALRSDPNVLSIEYRPDLHIHLTDTTQQINATTIWPRTLYGNNLTGKGETICVIDSGVNYTHPALGGCDNETFLAGNCSKVIAGYDFCADDTACAGGVYDNDPMDADGHGTHVAGIAAANGSITGIAPEAKIVALKVCNSTGSCPFGALSSAIEWCTNNASLYNISVITISLGSTSLYTDYCDASYSTEAGLINNAIAKNITVTISTGNDDSKTGIASPSCIQNATSVGWVDKSDAFAGGNRNSITDIVAPGSAVSSTCISGGSCAKQGTSMAAPHVAGAAALLQQSEKLRSNESLTKIEVGTALETFSNSLNDTGGLGLVFPRVNLYKAIDSLSTPTFIWISKPNSSLANQNITINLTASDTLFGIEGANITINSTEYEMTQSGNSYFYIYEVPDTSSIEYNVTIRDFVQSNTTDSVILDIGDGASPTYSNISTTTLNYSPANIFNITWEDDFNISTAWAEFDGTNYSAANTGNIYSFNVSAEVGDHNLTWYANDTSGNENNTGQLNITISRADPSLNLTLQLQGTNYTSDTITDNGTDANITVTFSGESSVILYQNSSLINQGASPLSNTSNYSIGVYNLTAFYNETQNYSSSSLTIILEVESTSEPPTSSKTSPADNNYTNSVNVTFSISATDASLANATLYVYNISSDLIYSVYSNISGTSNETSWIYNFNDGNYTWDALVADTGGNENFTVGGNYTFVVDLTNPSSLDLDIDDTTITTSENTNITCTGYDLNLKMVEIYIDGNGPENSSTTNFTSYYYDPSSSGSKVVSCRITDLAGNVNEQNQTITVSIVDSGGSSGSSSSSPSSSSSSATAAVTSKTTYSFNEVKAGDFARVTSNSGTKEATGVSQVSVLMKNTAKSFEISIGKTTSPSKEIPEDGEKVFSYMEIGHDNLNDLDISQVTINFEIEKSWFESSNVLPEGVVLKRLKSNKWEELTTKKLSEDSKVVKYFANSPGLSTFAITVPTLTAEIIGASANETNVTETGEESPKKTWTFDWKGWAVKLKWLWITLGIIVALAIGVWLSYYMNKVLSKGKFLSKKKLLRGKKGEVQPLLISEESM